MPERIALRMAPSVCCTDPAGLGLAHGAGGRQTCHDRAKPHDASKDAGRNSLERQDDVVGQGFDLGEGLVDGS